MHLTFIKMKYTLTYIIIIALFFSCGKDTDQSNESLTQLQDKKISITKSIDSLNSILRIIESNIDKLDNNNNKNLQAISIITPKEESFKHYIEIQGVVKSDKNIVLRSELGGTVLQIFVREGQQVKKGTVLVQLDDSNLKNNMAELNTEIILAKTTYDRQKRLWEQKIGSEMQYLQTKTQYESLENNVNTLKDQANKMKIIAPFSGVVDEIFSKKGELTNPQTQVVRLVNLDEVYIEADVTETYLPYIKIGNETLVRFPSINIEIVSTVAQVGNVINPNNRSFKTKINIPNKDNNLKPNLLADIKIVDLETNGIVIPSNLIQKDQIGDSYVYTVSNKNYEYLITRKLVKIANEYNHNSLIEDGLSANDTLVNRGARFVRNGEIVRITN